MEYQKIYFDMDGVLADFDHGVCDLLGLPLSDQNTDSKEKSDRMWAAIREYRHFYRDLKPIEGSVELFRRVMEAYGERCQILTGIPKPKRNIPEAGQDKIDWARAYLRPDVIVNIVLREDKIKYCFGKDCLLIDDYHKNNTAWRSKGGTAIDFTSAADALKQLQELNVL